MEQGGAVGRLARQLFAGGVEVSSRDPEQAIRTTRELIDFGILKWSTSAVCFGPPWAQQTSTLDLSVSLDLEAGVGLESQGGAIRADSVGIRVRGRHDPGRGAETARASAGGTGSDPERDTCTAQEDGATAYKDGPGGRVYRRDSGGRSQG